MWWREVSSRLHLLLLSNWDQPEIFQGISSHLCFTRLLPSTMLKRPTQQKKPKPELTFCTRAFTTSPGNKLQSVQFCRSVAMDAATSDRSMDKQTTLPSFFTSTMRQFRFWPIFKSGPTKISHSIKPLPGTLSTSFHSFQSFYRVPSQSTWSLLPAGLGTQSVRSQAETQRFVAHQPQNCCLQQPAKTPPWPNATKVH